MPSSTCGFASDTLHSTAITEEGECVVIDQFISGFVEFGSCMSLCNGKTNGIGKTLTKWPGGNFDSRSILSFWVARGNAVN